MTYLKKADRPPGRCSRCPNPIDPQGTATMCSRCANNRAFAEARRKKRTLHNIIIRHDRWPAGTELRYLRAAMTIDDAIAWTAFARYHRMSLSALAREAIRAYIETATASEAEADAAEQEVA